jgi:cell division transport system permease protein
MQAQALIAARSLAKRYGQAIGGQAALVDASFDVGAGEMVVVAGRSGAGKTTLLKLIAAIERPSGGSLFVSGQNLAAVSDNALPYVRRNIGIVFQDQKLLFDRSALENVLLPLDIVGEPRRDALRRAQAALDKVGLLARQNALPAALGRRTAAARHRARGRQPAGGDPRRRADGQPRHRIGRDHDEPVPRLPPGRNHGPGGDPRSRVGKAARCPPDPPRRRPHHRMITAWIRSHIRAFGEAGRYIGASGVSTLLAIVTIGIALTLPAAGRWMLGNLDHVGQRLGDTHEVTVFLATDATRADAQDIEKRLGTASAMSWRFVGKEEALATLQKQEGLQGLTAGLTRNPLPDAFVVRPRDHSPRALQDFAQHARTWPKVAAVQHDNAWAARYQSALRLGRTLVTLLGVAFALALVAATYNTIRLQILARREEIEVALLIGATRPWVARPFLWFGLIEGFLGALLAVFLLAATHLLLAPIAGELAKSYASEWRMAPPALTLLGLVLGGGTLLGLLGAWLSTRRIGRIVNAA